eukprot:jgi/Galph1/1894/GphlegSOOS_G562.1
MFPWSIVIGLTGSIASGKSTVVQLLQQKGVVVIDADVIARQVVEPGTFTYKRLVRLFGSQIVGPDGRLDRSRLGQIVFSDENKRRQLNGITHPVIIFHLIIQLLYKWICGYPFILLDVPLLFESKKLLWLCTITVVVSCEREQQVERLRKRNGFSTQECLQRIEAQMPLEQKAKIATFVVDNSGDMTRLAHQVEILWKQLQTIHNIRKRKGMMLSCIILASILGIAIFPKWTLF